MSLKTRASYLSKDIHASQVQASLSLGWSRFARHYSGNYVALLLPLTNVCASDSNRTTYRCFLFLWVLRCFTSPGCLHYPMNSGSGNLIFHQIGLPHSDIPGSKVACHLTEAYRRLLRPSSSFHTKASTICTYLRFNHKNE